MAARRRRTRRDDLGPDELARLHVLGAAREVTGSCFLVRTRTSRVLVECGLHQGSRGAQARNTARWPFAPGDLDAVVLTHAHIDHSGRLPRLVRDGYRGPVHVTGATRDLCRILLPDAAWIQEQDAERTNRRRRRQDRRLVEPLYTRDDAERALERLRPHPFDAPVDVAPDVRVAFRRAGHILGAASLEIWLRDAAHERKLVVSGDVGARETLLMRPPEPPAGAELVLMESTYGDRNHRPLDATLDELEQILADAERHGQNVIVPVFAVGRAQELLHVLGRMEREGRVTPRPVFLDSPMAIDVTDLTRRHPELLKDEIRRRASEDHELLTTTDLHFTRSAEESMAINDRRGVVILAASGMCHAGRILHHLKHNLWREGAHVVIVGFQARGSLGRALVDGARRVRVMGEEIAVKAHVHTLGGFSAHADRDGLLAWLEGLGEPRPAVALVHGEEETQQAFAHTLGQRLGVAPFVPALDDVLVVPRSGSAFRLEASDGRPRASTSPAR